MSLSDLYREPVPLDRGPHRAKRLVPLTRFERMATQNLAPVTVGEFAEVAKEYVIAFVPLTPPDGAAAAEVTPVALLGLRQRENLFVEADGRWGARYMPAFLRRYPFFYAPAPDGGAPALMVDAAYPGFNDSEGERLLGDDGEPAPLLQQTLRFLDEFEQQMQRTRAFCARVAALGLLKPVNIDLKLPDGQAFSATGLQVVDEAKLRELPADVAAELLRNGSLLLLHAHLLSSGNVHRLGERLAARLGTRGEAQAAAA
jgi:hypothetical protein